MNDLRFNAEEIERTFQKYIQNNQRDQRLNGAEIARTMDISPSGYRRLVRDEFQQAFEHAHKPFNDVYKTK